jgi:hypothetical protein
MRCSFPLAFLLMLSATLAVQALDWHATFYFWHAHQGLFVHFNWGGHLKISSVPVRKISPNGTLQAPEFDEQDRLANAPVETNAN